MAPRELRGGVREEQRDAADVVRAEAVVPLPGLGDGARLIRRELAEWRGEVVHHRAELRRALAAGVAVAVAPALLGAGAPHAMMSTAAAANSDKHDDATREK